MFNKHHDDNAEDDNIDENGYDDDKFVDDNNLYDYDDDDEDNVDHFSPFSKTKCCEKNAVPEFLRTPSF